MLRSYQVIALCVLALLSLGVVMVTSAGLEIAPRPSPPTTIEAQATTPFDTATSQAPASPAPARELSPMTLLRTPQTIFMGVALAAMAFAAFLPVRQLAERWAPSDAVSLDTPERRRDGLVLLILGCGVLLSLLALVYLAGIGKSAKGAERWLRIPMPVIGQLSVQPSEIAKWTLLGLVAWYGTHRAALMPLFWRGLVPALACVGLVAAAIVKEDLGTGALIAAAAGLILIAAGAKIWHFLLLSPLALAGVAAAIATSDYRVKRITAFLDPYADPQETGYHMIQSIGAIWGGGVMGRGLGHGIQKFGYLPEDTNDFIFAIICEELGAPGALLVVALFTTLLWACFLIVAREHNRLLKLFALGVLTTIGLQTLINLTVVTALGPTKGIALPLVSSGGSGWTMTAFSLGLLIAIGRTQTVAIPGLAVVSRDHHEDVRPTANLA
jgi:cell division protein FtsW